MLPIYAEVTSLGMVTTVDEEALEKLALEEGVVIRRGTKTKREG